MFKESNKFEKFVSVICVYKKFAFPRKNCIGLEGCQ